MKKTRRKFSTEFKTKVSIEAIKERYTLSELAKRFDLHPNQISQWKREFLSNATQAFTNGKSPVKDEDSIDINQLYQEPYSNEKRNIKEKAKKPEISTFAMSD